jgi:hypothetical protein
MWGYPDTFIGTDTIPTNEVIGKAKLQTRQRVKGAAAFAQEAT